MGKGKGAYDAVERRVVEYSGRDVSCHSLSWMKAAWLQDRGVLRSLGDATVVSGLSGYRHK